MRPPPIGGGFMMMSISCSLLGKSFNEAAADWRRIQAQAHLKKVDWDMLQ